MSGEVKHLIALFVVVSMFWGLSWIIPFPGKIVTIISAVGLSLLGALRTIELLTG